MATNKSTFNFTTDAKTAEEIFNELENAFKDKPTLTVKKENIDEQSFRIVVCHQQDPNNPLVISESKSEILRKDEEYEEVVFVKATDPKARKRTFYDTGNDKSKRVKKILDDSGVKFEVEKKTSKSELPSLFVEGEGWFSGIKEISFYIWNWKRGSAL